MKQNGIDTRPLFYPISDMPMYRSTKNMYTINAHKIYSKGINLPSSTKLTDTQIKYICDQIKEVISSSRY